MNEGLIFPEEYRLGLEDAGTYFSKKSMMQGKKKLYHSLPHVAAQHLPFLTALAL